MKRKVDNLTDRVDKMDTRLCNMEDSNKVRFAAIDGKLAVIEGKFTVVEGKIDSLKKDVKDSYKSLLITCLELKKKLYS